MFDRVDAFLFDHNLKLDGWPVGRTLLAAFLAGHEATRRAIAAAPESVLGSEPSFGVLYQLSERACEHIAGSIACVSTKNAASAELAARAAIEISVNMRFMLSGDCNSRVVAWIRAYVQNDESQISQWEKALQHLSATEREHSLPRIATRKTVLELRRRWLKDAETEFAKYSPLNLKESWPNIAHRFEKIGEAVAYRTAYARLSSQTHADAEDTLNYIFFSVNGDKWARHQMAQETVAFTEYLIAYSIFFYFLAMKFFCTTFSLNNPPGLAESTTTVLGVMEVIGNTWKW